MQAQQIVSRGEWLAAHAALTAKEKALTRVHDDLAAQRRRQPWELVEKPYVFIGPDGQTDLQGLFQGRSQLILYHHMLQPRDPSPCAGCGMFTDNIGSITHLNQRDTTLALVATAPIGEIEALKRRLGWSMPFYEGTQQYFEDFHGQDYGLNVFIRHDGSTYRTYYTTGRGVETLGTIWSFLDLTPMGRQESWENSPEGTPQTAPYQWWRLNDEYAGKKVAKGACCG